MHFSPANALSTCSYKKSGAPLRTVFQGSHLANVEGILNLHLHVDSCGPRSVVTLPFSCSRERLCVCCVEVTVARKCVCG